MKRTYTPEYIRQEALKYKSRQELKKVDNGLHQAATRRGMIDEISSHMENHGYTYHRWTREELIKIAAKYSTLKDFRENEYDAHQALSSTNQGNGQPSPWNKYWLEATAHLERAWNEWTEEELLEESLLYSSRGEMQKASSGAYRAIKKLGLNKKAFAHMELRTGFWTVKKCKQEALKCKTRKELSETGGLISAIGRYGILDECCSHMDNNGYSLSHRKWTKGELLKKAAKYSTIADFRTNEPQAYDAFSSPPWNEYREEAFAHLIYKNSYWTEEEIAEKAAQYTGRAKFEAGCRSAYSAARRRGILDKVCSHMQPVGNLLDRVVYVYEWPESNTAYVGLTWNEEQRKASHFRAQGSYYSPVKKYVEEGNGKYDYKTLTDYIPAKEAVLEEKCIIQEYRDNGWQLLNKSKGGELGTSHSPLP